MTQPISTNTVNPALPRPANPPRPALVPGATFAEALDRAGRDAGVRFSSHAQKRMEVRDIRLDDTGLARLNDAVERAARHGGRQSLVLMDDLAFIVNVRDRLIVTALDGGSRKEGVFTQIDSVVLALEGDKS
ncbi:MAG: flagellar protein [Chloroflexi bacterium]|nr:flagellar protein [Chloroflexota bacterium]